MLLYSATLGGQVSFFRQKTMQALLNIWRSKSAGQERTFTALVLVAALLLAGCDVSFASSNTGMSDSGNPIVVVNNQEVIYATSTCNGPVALTIKAGANLVDLGPANSTCEQIAYPSEVGYTQTGYDANAYDCSAVSGRSLAPGRRTTRRNFLTPSVLCPTDEVRDRYCWGLPVSIALSIRLLLLTPPNPIKWDWEESTFFSHWRAVSTA